MAFWGMLYRLFLLFSIEIFRKLIRIGNFQFFFNPFIYFLSHSFSRQPNRMFEGCPESISTCLNLLHVNLNISGIEVKPGKPFTHKFDDLRGRLHVSMVTLFTQNLIFVAVMLLDMVLNSSLVDDNELQWEILVY